MKKATYHVPHDGRAAGTAPRWSCTSRRSSAAAWRPREDRRASTVGSTTVKAVVVEDGKAGWQDYQRHNTARPRRSSKFLGRMEAEAGLTPAATASSSPAPGPDSSRPSWAAS